MFVSRLDLARRHLSSTFTYLTDTVLVTYQARRTPVRCGAATVRTSGGIIGNRYFAIAATCPTDSILTTDTARRTPVRCGAAAMTTSDYWHLRILPELSFRIRLPVVLFYALTELRYISRFLLILTLSLAGDALPAPNG